jgi:hypothetical protein
MDKSVNDLSKELMTLLMKILAVILVSCVLDLDSIFQIHMYAVYVCVHVYVCNKQQPYHS